MSVFGKATGRKGRVFLFSIMETTLWDTLRKTCQREKVPYTINLPLGKFTEVETETKYIGTYRYGLRNGKGVLYE